MSNKIISSLTPEQEAKIADYRKMFRDIGLSTTQTDKASAEAAILRSYRYLNKKDPATWDSNPNFVWADSPYQGAVLAAQFAKGDARVTVDEIRAQADNASFGSFDAYWVSTYSYIANELPVKVDELHEIATEIVKTCGVYWTFEKLVVMTPKPTVISMETDRLHSVSGKALEYINGDGIYAYKGDRKGSLMEVVMASRNDSFKNEEKED